MQCSGLQVVVRRLQVVFKFVVLLAGTILIGISIFTSSWSTIGGKATSSQVGLGDWGSTGGYVERGLWQECYHLGASIGNFKAEHDQCRNRLQAVIENAEKLNNGDEIFKALSKELQAWEIAVLALMAGSVVLGILSLVFSPCCCNRCGCFLASFVFFAASLCAAGICTYAYYISTGQGNRDFELNTKHFGWSYWCAVAGGACQFFAGIMFSVSRCRQHSYSHTI